MAAAPQSLTLAEFRARFHDQKPYYEYWFGEAIQKQVPTWLHALLQSIVSELLRRAGYKSGTELELHIDPEWQPVPDVVGSLKSMDRYPEQPVEVVVEILSPDDRMTYVMNKCRHYQRVGIPQIFVLDPDAKQSWQWTNNGLEIISEMRLSNGAVISFDSVWRQFDEQR